MVVMQNIISFQNTNSILRVFLLFLGLIILSCGSAKVEVKDKDMQEVIFYPAGQKEKILDENGNEVQITNRDPELFQRDSKNSEEVFRVIISSESYQNL